MVLAMGSFTSHLAFLFASLRVYHVEVAIAAPKERQISRQGSCAIDVIAGWHRPQLGSIAAIQCIELVIVTTHQHDGLLARRLINIHGSLNLPVRHERPDLLPASFLQTVNSTVPRPKDQPISQQCSGAFNGILGFWIGQLELPHHFAGG